MKKGCLWACLFSIATCCLAVANDDWPLLGRASRAGRDLPLDGVYLHQMNGTLETFRLTRVHDRDGVLERRLALDGIPREIIRKNSLFTCYAPNKKLLIDARVNVMRLFPALISDRLDNVAQSYTLSRLHSDRVAERSCRWLELKAKDKRRYSLRICVDSTTALPLKTMTLTPQGDIVEQYIFTEINLTHPVNQAELKPKYKFSSPLKIAVPGPAQNHMASRVEVAGLPTGFYLLRALERSLKPGRADGVQHMVFSDGVAFLSIFVEPVGLAMSTARVLNLNGAINMASAARGEQLITLVGDMPKPALAALVKSIHVVMKP